MVYLLYGEDRVCKKYAKIFGEDGGIMLVSYTKMVQEKNNYLDFMCNFSIP